MYWQFIQYNKSMSSSKRNIVGLTINQRNILQYYYNHKRKHKDLPCFVPRLVIRGGCIDNYIRALEALETMGAISLDRTSPHYTAWIIKDPVDSSKFQRTSDNATVFK